jgi:hypothetical protein
MVRRYNIIFIRKLRDFGKHLGFDDEPAHSKMIYSAHIFKSTLQAGEQTGSTGLTSPLHYNSMG